MKVRIDSNRFPGRVTPTTLMVTEIDSLGASQYEIALDLHLGDRSVVPLTIDVDTAKELAVALIEQATLSTADSNAALNVDEPPF